MSKYSIINPAFLLFAVALLTRLLWVEVPINTDETLWVDRGALFFAALLKGELEETYLRHHPGVTNMWLIGGTFSLRYLLREIWPLSESLAKLVPESSHLGGASGLVEYLKALASDGAVPVAAYVQVRVVFALVTAASMTGIYLLTRRLLGQRVALIMAALLLLEPFYLAYQRFITTDGNQSNFMWLALLAFLLYLRQSTGTNSGVAATLSGAWRWLLLSAVCYGLALLSKVAVLLSLPAIGLWLLWYSTRSNALDHSSGARATTKVVTTSQSRWLRRDLILWALGVAITCWLLWPVLWVALPSTLFGWYEDLSGEVAGHYQFFLGQTTDDPGVLYYPVVLLWRLSPALLLGTLLGIVGLFLPALRRHMPDRTVLIAILLNLVIIFLGISSQSSKLDRYIIPLIPGLAILAAAGWSSIFSWGAERWLSNRNQSTNNQSTNNQSTSHQSTLPLARRPLAFALGVVVLLQLAVLLPHLPYHVTYFNPLLGGPAAAQEMIMVGNGELLDEVGAWLQQHTPVPELVEGPAPKVASWYHQVLGAYYEGPMTSMWNGRYGKWRWVDGRYVVLYVSQIQRNLPFVEQIDYFAMQEPRHVVRAHGVDYAYIYDGPTLLPEDVAQIPTPINFDFADHVRLLGYEMSAQIASGDSSLLTLYWQAKTPFPDEKFWVFVRLRSADGRSYSEHNQKPVGGFFPVDQWEPGQLIRDVKEVRIPPGTPPGSYNLELSFYSGALQKGLEIHDEQGSHGDWISLAPITVTPPAHPFAVDPASASKEELQIAHPLTDTSAFSIGAPSSPPGLGGSEGGQIAPTRLLGYEWGEITLARAGDAIPLTLLWQVGEQARQIGVYLQLRQGDQQWQRVYARPIGGTDSPDSKALAAQWRSGELIRDIWEPYLPADAPSGRYQLDLVAELSPDPESSPHPPTPSPNTGRGGVAPRPLRLNLGEIEIEAREHNFSAPQPDFPQIAELGEKVRLLGYRHKREVQAAEDLSIILYWQALGEMERNYTRFIHLLNSQGERVAQRDSQPGEGSLPTTSWVTNEILSESVPLNLPEELPPGEYKLIVGFYDPTNWQRLISSDGADHILLTQPIQVIQN
ncbi:MAG: ArnT family glycosyltransferase [Ardenticatenaceae bacterium]